MTQRHAGAVPVWFLSKMCRSEVTVALSGDGADELFGGYNTYLADRYARTLRRLPRSLLRWAANLTRMLPVSDEKIGLDYKLTRMLQGSFVDPVSAHLFWNGTFSPGEKFQTLQLPGPGAGYLNRFLWLDQLNYLPDDILYKTDRMSMAHSLEVRPPFLDHRVVEFAGSLPENLKIRGTRLKFVLRELMKDKLPPVSTRPKEGFDIPVHHWPSAAATRRATARSTSSSSSPVTTLTRAPPGAALASRTGMPAASHEAFEQVSC